MKKSKKKISEPKGKPEKPKRMSGLSEQFERWKSGTPMSELLKELGLRRRELKQKFAKLAGGKDKLEALRAAGAGGAAFGGKRGGGRTKEIVLADDSKVKCVHSSKKWQPEYLYKHVIVRVDLGKEGKANFPWRELVATIWVNPKGNKYVVAKPMETADLLVVVGDKKFWGYEPPVMRLRKLERSSVLKKLKAEEELLKRGMKAQKHRKKIKKAKRAAKKAAKQPSTKSK
jgi:hypothetical protein